MNPHTITNGTFTVGQPTLSSTLSPSWGAMNSLCNHQKLGGSWRILPSHQTDIRNHSPVILGLVGLSPWNSGELRPSCHTPRPEILSSGSTQWFLTHSPVLTSLRRWGGFQTQHLWVGHWVYFINTSGNLLSFSLCLIVPYSTGFVNTFLHA